ncbi:hypothetical protein CQ12_05630 [Bradyrhizobium jicamae]|uniref:Uncharacterized protein n=1 Tax=Bradyrhizobium jicamae TaxID=280332 RepID=A0A0R3LTP2_9BRAD|nr:hypothetical protein CQ12_05630 [Bradyrhizobium jicamae]
MMKIAFVMAAAVVTTAPLVTPAKAQDVKMAQIDMQTGRHYEAATPATIGNVAGMTPTPLLVSVQAVSPSAHDSAAAWRLPRLNGTTAAGSRAGSASAN